MTAVAVVEVKSGVEYRTARRGTPQGERFLVLRVENGRTQVLVSYTDAKAAAQVRNALAVRAAREG